MLLFSFNSCNGALEEEKCWVFTIQTVIVTTFGQESDTQTATTTLEECDLTSTEAKDAAQEMEGTTTTTLEGMTVTTTITVTYEEAA
jgi:hypothetical protein